jgi:hypothetical protein
MVIGVTVYGGPAHDSRVYLSTRCESTGCRYGCTRRFGDPLALYGRWNRHQAHGQDSDAAQPTIRNLASHTTASCLTIRPAHASPFLLDSSSDKEREARQSAPSLSRSDRQRVQVHAPTIVQHAEDTPWPLPQQSLRRCGVPLHLGSIALFCQESLQL